MGACLPQAKHHAPLLSPRPLGVQIGTGNSVGGRGGGSGVIKSQHKMNPTLAFFLFLLTGDGKIVEAIKVSFVFFNFR